MSDSLPTRDWMIVEWATPRGVELECGDANNCDGAYLRSREQAEAFIADLREVLDRVWPIAEGKT